ncbi:MAG: glucose-1-phosphate adenylyltransferase [Planctomycetia bacterium]|nr:glucose-1-phosphate adenylyltransferase [Planctomycetia bacterium]
MKKNVIVLILGGGRGTRLYPLTKMRAKPAVPIAGKYRLIDIPISNCINSGLNKIYVITQFNSVSLHHHLKSYHFDAFSHGFVEMLAAQQTNDSSAWYQGTADAVRQNFNFIRQRDVDYVLILSGDQLYRMDFQKMIETHERNNADVTIATVPVQKERASELGIMRINEEGQVLGFLEKPKTDEELEHVYTGEDFIRDRGYDPQGREYLANMGVYLFNRQTLVDALTKTDYTDFGKEVFPAAIRTRKVCVHLFDGYWEDIGTIRSFYEANLALAQNPPTFEISPPEAPTYSKMRYLPASRFENATISRSFIADGCQIGNGAVIENSIIGIRSKIGRNCVIRNSIIMGQDFITRPEDDKLEINAGRPAVGIGDCVIIDGAIVDKNVQIGHNVVIRNDNNVQNTQEREFGMIRDGVICVEKGAVLPPYWSLTESLKK